MAARVRGLCVARPGPVALGSQGLDPPSPALDFVFQSKLALKHKVSEGAGHDDDV
jgi:hypothetical protein